MRIPRLSLAKLMIVVGLAALNLAAIRVLHDYNSEILLGVALAGLALQVALFQFLHSRGRRRAFWAGFLVCGLMAISTFIWAMLFPEVFGLSRTGVLHITPGSPLYSVWHGYEGFVFERIIRRFLFDPRANLEFDRDSALGNLLIACLRAVVWFLPQLLIALVGGLLASLIRRPLPVRARSASE